MAQLGPGSFSESEALLWTIPVTLIFAFSLTLEGMRLGKSEGEETIGGFFLSLAIPTFPFLLLIGRGMMGSFQTGQIALAIFFAGFGLIQCGLAFTRRFPEDRRQVLGSGLLLFGEVLSLIGLFCGFENPNLMLLMSACSLFSSLVAYRHDQSARFLGSALIAGTLAASSSIALIQDWPNLFPRRELWVLYHSPIAWAYAIVAMMLSKRKAEQATIVHILSALLTLAFATRLGEPGSYLCIASLIYVGTVLISRQEHYSFAAAAFLGLGSISLTYENGYKELEQLALAGAVIALALRLIVGPARHFAATKAFSLGFTAFSAIFGIWAFAGSPLQGPASTLCLTASLLSLSSLVGLFQKRNAFDAMFITASLVLLSVSIPAFHDNAIKSLLHPHAGLTMVITTAALSLLACGLAFWKADWKKTVTLPMGIVSTLIAVLAVFLQLVLDMHFAHDVESLNYAGAAASLSGLTMLALSVQCRSRILSFLAGLHVLGAFALVTSVLDLHDEASFPIYTLALAFFFAEAPRLLAMLRAPEDELEPHRVMWPLLAFLATLPIDVLLVMSFLEQLRGVELELHNTTIALSLLGLIVLHSLRVQEGKQSFFGVFASVHIYLTLTALVLLLPFEVNSRLAILSGLLPSVVLALSFLPKTEEDPDNWKAVLQGSLSHVSTGLGALFLPIAFIVFVSGETPGVINTGAAIGCLALGTYFSRLTISNWSGLFYCAYASYSLCMAFACVSITPNRAAALGAGLAIIGALAQGLGLWFRERAEEFVDDLAKHMDICLLASLPVAMLLTLVGPLHNLTPITLLFIGFAGIAGARTALISVGAVATSVAAFRAVALFYDGSGNNAEEVLGLGFVSVTLAYFSSLASRALAGRGETWDLRAKILGNVALIHAGMASLAIFSISMFIRQGEAAPQAVGFLGGIFMLVTLFAFWIYEAHKRESEVLVYFAEFCLATIFLFVRACKPALFQTGLFRRFWPLIVIFISFLSVFLSSLLNRLDKDIFGRATRRTGLFLPIIALLGSHFFVEIGVSSLTFFVAAGLYAWVGAQRKSLPLSILASWLFCIGLIDFIVYGNISFEFYPYLFAAPVSMTFLATSFLVREKYPSEAKILKDTGALILFAVLSWSLFADEQGQVLESILLAIMSILGLILGIRLKERSLMILGTLFVLLDLVTNIYWIGKEQAWVWWVSVMALGIAVILLFSYFERLQVLFEKREEDTKKVSENSAPKEKTDD
ncbi:MAG: hypothetical protein P1V97_15535 [Planctomycetota bacterium]|nr:hypothetical protein [Planctomycetota bacterium]